jgi:hypothetical protein
MHRALAACAGIKLEDVQAAFRAVRAALEASTASGEPDHAARLRGADQLVRVWLGIVPLEARTDINIDGPLILAWKAPVADPVQKPPAETPALTPRNITPASGAIPEYSNQLVSVQAESRTDPQLELDVSSKSSSPRRPSKPSTTVSSDSTSSSATGASAKRYWQ